MAKSFIGFFDILGFKDLVENNSHKKLLKLYEEAMYTNVDEIARIGFELHDDEAAKLSLGKIKKLIISDSIIFIQEDFTHRGLFFLILQSKVLLAISMREGIPLRGGISLGEISLFEKMGTTLLGKGLTNAYQLEASQEWSGAAIDPKCFEIHPNDNQFLFLLMHGVGEPLVLPYDIPVKQGKVNKGLAVNWIGLKRWENLASKFTKHNKKISSDKEQKIIENTINFSTYARMINLKAQAAKFFDILSMRFGAALHDVDYSNIDTMCTLRQNDSWQTYMLRSKYYQRKEELGKTSITNILTNKSIVVNSIKGDGIEFQLLKSLSNKFLAFKQLPKTERIILINQLLSPWH